MNLPFGYFRFMFTITQNSKVGIPVLVTKSKVGIPALHFMTTLRAETTFGDEHFVDLFRVSRDNQEVMSPCRRESICRRRRRCFLRVVAFWLPCLALLGLSLRLPSPLVLVLLWASHVFRFLN